MRKDVVDQELVGYRAYMLRFWIMDNDSCPQWRLSLEDVHGDGSLQFKSIADIVVYLLMVMESEAEQLHADA